MAIAVDPDTLPLPRVERPPRHGTAILHRWSEWSKANGHATVTAVEVLARGEFRLVVHEYSNGKCCLLKLATTAPRVRDFREWHQPLRVVIDKLVANGWQWTSGRPREVSHAH